MGFFVYVFDLDGYVNVSVHHWRILGAAIAGLAVVHRHGYVVGVYVLVVQLVLGLDLPRGGVEIEGVRRQFRLAHRSECRLRRR